ncbi:hypothetical protein F2Q70_00015824 [Brassica cretica]|uniref:Uncharacterized protein n=1 Tax=Brassica cretica TaxID=69181 RepID=A0A8S9I4J2_BRACR|nr:hypothetical protein F2Q70_00015824 [Brassica cretica]
MERRRIEGDERYPHHQGKTTVWNRLDDRPDGRDRRKPVVYNSRPRQTSMERQERQREREPYRPRDRHYSHQSQASQQAWRPRTQRKEGKSCSPSRTVTNSKYQSVPNPEKADSQQTISRGLQVRNGPDGYGTGVLVVHKNETSERLRRLKGKAIMREDLSAKSPSSAFHQTPHAILTRDRGAVVIKEGGIRSSPHALRMDEDMVQNDDLLIDKPGYDAEIIDAISQLSPANVVYKENGETTGAEKEPQPTTMNQMKNKSAGSSKIPQASSGQSRAGGTREEKKKSYQSSELKGVEVSKKLNALRGRPSPRKRGSGSVGSQKPPSKKI